jgi:hypothetical protein
MVVICLYGCRKSCATCDGYISATVRYDSTLVASYDTISHRYDTLLVKVDTTFKEDSFIIYHLCPGNPAYNNIDHNTAAGYEYYDPSHRLYLFCIFDQ